MDGVICPYTPRREPSGQTNFVWTSSRPTKARPTTCASDRRGQTDATSGPIRCLSVRQCQRATSVSLLSSLPPSRGGGAPFYTPPGMTNVRRHDTSSFRRHVVPSSLQNFSPSSRTEIATSKLCRKCVKMCYHFCYHFLTRVATCVTSRRVSRHGSPLGQPALGPAPGAPLPGPQNPLRGPRRAICHFFQTMPLLRGVLNFCI